VALHASVSGGRRIRESNHAAAEGEEALGPPPPPLAPLSAITNAALHPSLSAILFCLLRRYDDNPNYCKQLYYGLVSFPKIYSVGHMNRILNID